MFSLIFERQIFLDETGAEVNIHLDERRITNAFEAMDLSGFDHKDIARASLKGLAVHPPKAATFPYKLDFVIRVPMWSGTSAGLGTEQENGDIHVALFGANELM